MTHPILFALLILVATGMLRVAYTLVFKEAPSSTKDFMIYDDGHGTIIEWE